MTETNNNTCIKNKNNQICLIIFKATTTKNLQQETR